MAPGEAESLPGVWLATVLDGFGPASWQKAGPECDPEGDWRTTGGRSGWREQAVRAEMLTCGEVIRPGVAFGDRIEKVLMVESPQFLQDTRTRNAESGGHESLDPENFVASPSQHEGFAGYACKKGPRGSSGPLGSVQRNAGTAGAKSRQHAGLTYSILLIWEVISQRRGKQKSRRSPPSGALAA